MSNLYSLLDLADEGPGSRVDVVLGGAIGADLGDDLVGQSPSIDLRGPDVGADQASEPQVAADVR